MRVPAVGLLGLLAACGGSPDPIGVPLRSTPRFAAEWAEYLQLPGPKALVFAGDPDGVYVSAAVHRDVSNAHAVERALAYCELRRADRGIAHPCQVYAVGDEPLLHDPAHPRSPPPEAWPDTRTAR